eukprot:CAMPEP_0115170974 /NCGR_PEP_ID=MMETSP0270-20121206/2068_1 /TAXON_ID=71861 /ORGANISM="Scrippsiella trochoidea, Strain CCMP3099" /LENGTH=129 /DNA_ID=CAMNT_0002583735 /DNA_START=669 /DNA_END=1059 /DNA_ORIENTATION=-
MELSQRSEFSKFPLETDGLSLMTTPREPDERKGESMVMQTDDLCNCRKSKGPLRGLLPPPSPLLPGGMKHAVSDDEDWQHFSRSPSDTGLVVGATRCRLAHAMMVVLHTMKCVAQSLSLMVPWPCCGPG